MYKATGQSPFPIASGRTLEPGDEVADKDVDLNDPNDSAHIESGRLVKVASSSKGKSAGDGDDDKKDGENR